MMLFQNLHYFITKPNVIGMIAKIIEEYIVFVYESNHTIRMPAEIPFILIVPRNKDNITKYPFQLLSYLFFGKIWIFFEYFISHHHLIRTFNYIPPIDY